MTLVDVQEIAPNLGELTKNLKSEASSTQAQEESARNAQSQPENSSLPEKYRGKCLEDIVKMHQEAESMLGRMANDLGTQRKLTDQLLELKRAEDLNQNGGNVRTPDLPEVSSTQLLDDPVNTLNNFVSAKTKELETTTQQKLAEFERKIAEQTFTSQHPDYQQIGHSEDFSTWLNESAIRRHAAQQALSGDYQMASELLTEYKRERKKNTEKAAENNTTGNFVATQNGTTDRIQAAVQASLESHSSSEASNSNSKPKYRRSDLIALRTKDPSTYAALEKEILQAYAEGRVT